MPKYREVFLEKGKTLGDSGTQTIEIGVVDPISELHILMWATNGATSNKNNPIARNVTKIEVVDGADVLFSMDGRLAQALAYYWTKKYPYKAWQEYGGAAQEDVFPIRFGRWLWDPIYALAPGKFRNLQLKITWNLANVTAVGATGFESGSAKLTVIARIMEALAEEPTGFLMHKNHYSFTSAASGDERIDLPTDYPYALLMIRAWESGVGINSSITNLKISIDEDKDIPLDMSLAYIEELIEEEYGLIEHGIRMYGDHGDVKQVWLAMQERAALNCETDPVIANFHDLMNGQMTLDLYNHDGITATGKMLQCKVQGQLPWNCVGYSFGKLDDPTTYLQAQEHGKIRAILTQGDAGAEVDIVLSQLRSY